MTVLQVIETIKTGQENAHEVMKQLKDPRVAQRCGRSTHHHLTDGLRTRQARCKPLNGFELAANYFDPLDMVPRRPAAHRSPPLPRGGRILHRRGPAVACPYSSTSGKFRGHVFQPNTYEPCITAALTANLSLQDAETTNVDPGLQIQDHGHQCPSGPEGWFPHSGRVKGSTPPRPTYSHALSAWRNNI